MTDWREYLTADETRRLDEILSERQALMREKLRLHDTAKKRRARSAPQPPSKIACEHDHQTYRRTGQDKRNAEA